MMDKIILGLVTKQDLFNLLAAMAQTDADYWTLNLVSKATTGHELPPPIVSVSRPTVLELPTGEVTR